MIRSLSSQESKLILRLEWEKQPFLTAKHVQETLGVSNGNARVILHRLVEKGWLFPVVPGIFEYIPAERGEEAFVDTNSLALGSVLVEPYAFAYATAAYHHGLTTQASTKVYIQTNNGKSHTITARGKPYRVTVVQNAIFFGIINVNAYGASVKMTDIEKTVVDCLDQPQAAGDIPEIAGMLWLGKNQFNWQRLIDYSFVFNKQTLIQRLGFLCDSLKIQIPNHDRERMLGKVDKNFCYLGRPAKWGKGGKLNKMWQVVENIQEREVYSEIRIA